MLSGKKAVIFDMDGTLTDSMWIWPEDCTVLYNENGTAPGMVIHAKEGKKVVLLPGPPNELLPMFHDQVEPIIKELSSEVLYSDVVKIDCMGESRVAAEIEDGSIRSKVIEVGEAWQKH